MTDGAKLGERAVVVGSGMGGLFAARVLSDHFDEVVVLDPPHAARDTAMSPRPPTRAACCA